MKTTGWTRFLALCLAVISLSMLVSGGLGIRAANKERRKDESELRDLQSRIDEYREISAALMDRVSYEELNKALEEKQKKYDTDTAKHRADLSTYTATNGGLEMGTAALNQAESALETGKTQIVTLKKALRKMLNMLERVTGLTGGISSGLSTAEEVMSKILEILSDDGVSGGNSGSVLRLESAVSELIDALENYSPPAGSEQADGTASGGNGGAGFNTNTGDDASNNSSDGSEEQEKTGGEEQLAEPGDGQENPVTDPPEDPDTDPPEDLDTDPSEDPPADPPEEPETDPAEAPPRSPETGETDSGGQRVQTALDNVVTEMRKLLEDAAVIRGKAETVEVPPNIMDGILQAAEVGSAGEFMSIIREALPGEDPEADAETLQQVYDILQTIAAMDAGSQQLADRIREASELAGNIEEIGALVREAINRVLPEALTENPEFPSGNEEFLRQIKETYEANKGDIQMIPELLEDERASAYEAVNSAYEKLTGLNGQISAITKAQSQLAEQLSVLRETEKELEEGEAALAEGRAQLDAAKDEQKKKAEELDKKKRDLDAQEKLLQQSAEEAEEQKKLEEREKTLKSALLSREEIRRGNRDGMDLLTASEKWLEEYTRQAGEKYRDRFDAGVLMMIGAVLAMAGALLSFGKNANPYFAPVVTILCLAFSGSAAFLLYRMGRGISWSAAVTALIAAAELVLLIPSLPVFGQAADPGGPRKARTGKTGTKSAENPDEKKK